jgi:hypothetical protein
MALLGLLGMIIVQCMRVRVTVDIQLDDLSGMHECSSYCEVISMNGTSVILLWRFSGMIPVGGKSG